jgi:hypothetical protein
MFCTLQPFKTFIRSFLQFILIVWPEFFEFYLLCKQPILGNVSIFKWVLLPVAENLTVWFWNVTSTTHGFLPVGFVC